MKLFEVGKLSCGQAADAAGFSMRAFIELLAKHGIAVVDYSLGDLPDDFGNA